jgi:hypothetical protein
MKTDRTRNSAENTVSTVCIVSSVRSNRAQED